MPASYPSSLFTATTINNGDTSDASQINNPVAEIIAVETGLLSGFQHVVKALTDNTYDLGTSSVAWRDLFVKRNLTHQGYAGVGALLVSNASKQLVEQALTNGQLMIGSTGAAPVAASLTAGTGITITPAAGGITIASSAPVISLLKANSGTDTNAGATTVDSVATGALTAKDRLLVLVSVEEVTQLVARLDVYSVTDATNICRLSTGGTIGAGVSGSMQVNISQAQTAATKYISNVLGATTGGNISEASNNALATAWTTGFTIGLRHGGVTAGGTFAYSWAVFKIAGQ